MTQDLWIDHFATTLHNWRLITSCRSQSTALQSFMVRPINADARTPLVAVAIPISMPWSDVKGAYDNFFQKHKGSRRHALKTELIMSFSFNFASIIVLLSTQGPYKRDRDHAPSHGCVAAAVLAVSI